jgi:hypothetical protein
LFLVYTGKDTKLDKSEKKLPVFRDLLHFKWNVALNV